MKSGESWLSNVFRVFGATQEKSGRVHDLARNSHDLARILANSATTASGAVVNDSTAMRVAAVYACVRVLSDAVGMLPLGLYRREGKTIRAEERHPVAELLSVRPNRWQTPFEFKRLILGHMALRGNAYCVVVRLGNRVQELIPLHPGRVTVRQLPSLNLEYVYERPDGSRTTYAQAEMLHLRALSSDGVVGLSPIGVAAQAIGLALQTEKHGARMFSNGAAPAGVLKHPQVLSQEAAQRLADSFQSAYGGADNAGKTIVLEEGMGWEAVGMNAEETQFIESRKFQRSEIAMFFGVPPHMIGDIERGTSWGSGIEQQGIGFVTYTLRPWLVNIGEAIARDLLTAEERRTLFAQFDTDDLTRADFLTRQNGLRVMYDAGVISPNEWRESEGYNPRPGGDEYAGRTAPQPQPQPQSPGVPNAA